jgi:TatD DNase family protein
LPIPPSDDILFSCFFRLFLSLIQILYGREKMTIREGSDMFIDTHAHLQDKAFKADYNEVIARARSAGVQVIILPGSNLSTSRKALEMNSRDSALLPAVGIHPHDARKAGEEELRDIEVMARKQNVVAVGEIGLDFHYNFSPAEVQEQALRLQIRMAHRVKKPLILHSRESQDRLISILREEEGDKRGGVVHCFSGSEKEAYILLEMGFCLGFTGIITFKSSQELRTIASKTPLDRILVETDSPYLAPQPHRGSRNEPSYIPLIIEEMAKARQETVDAIADAVLANAMRVFSISDHGSAVMADRARIKFRKGVKE